MNKKIPSAINTELLHQIESAIIFNPDHNLDKLNLLFRERKEVAKHIMRDIEDDNAIERFKLINKHIKKYLGL